MHACSSVLLLAVLLCLTGASQAAVEQVDRGTQSAQPLFLRDAQLGIHTFSTVVGVGVASHGGPARQLHARLHVRQSCEPGPLVSLDAFLALHALSSRVPSVTAAEPHFLAPPLDSDSRPVVRILAASTGAELGVLAFQPPYDQSLWRGRASLPPGQHGYLLLSISGSAALLQLPRSSCAEPQQEPETPALDPASLQGKLWNVLTTTSDSSLPPASLALLALSHQRYHAPLGFQGTILRANMGESQGLVRLPSVQAAIEARRLILWPWEAEHFVEGGPYFWQRPRNQLTLLGARGRGMRLAFLDMDEYLVLANGSDVDSATCTPAHGGPAEPLLSATHSSWMLARYQAKACPEHDLDLSCWEDGRTLSATGFNLYHDVCPMGMFHGKVILGADATDTIGVHSSFAAGNVSHANVPTRCAWLMHLYTLLSSRRSGVTKVLHKLPLVRWQLREGRARPLFQAGMRPHNHSDCEASTTPRIQFLRAAQLHQEAAKLTDHLQQQARVRHRSYSQWQQRQRDTLQLLRQRRAQAWRWQQQQQQALPARMQPEAELRLQ